MSLELTVVSAHRTPERMMEYAKTAHKRGLQVIIAGAGEAGLETEGDDGCLCDACRSSLQGQVRT